MCHKPCGFGEMAARTERLHNTPSIVISNDAIENPRNLSMTSKFNMIDDLDWLVTPHFTPASN
jgi:hypothetical protein